MCSGAHWLPTQAASDTIDETAKSVYLKTARGPSVATKPSESSQRFARFPEERSTKRATM